MEQAATGAVSATEANTAGRRTRLIVGLIAGIGVLLLLGANAHLVYVATMSQPACVPHVRLGQDPPAAGAYPAAQSACSPIRRNGDAG
jgi:hypothetical protein